MKILTAHKDDLTVLKTRRLIEDFDKNEWEFAKKEAENNLNSQLGEYFLSQPQLPDLERGLELLGYYPISVRGTFTITAVIRQHELPCFF